MRLAQGHNAVTPVRLEPAAPRSGVKYSKTESLRSLDKRRTYPLSTTLLRSCTCFELRTEIFNNKVRVTSKGSNQPAHMRRLIRAFASRLNIL